MTSLAAALLLAFSACSQDEIVSGGDSLLPDGQYPLLIGDVSIVAQSSEEPWTRVAENTTDGASSVWETDDVIGVRFDGDPSYFGENAPIPFTEKGRCVFKRATEGPLTLSPVEGEEIYWKGTYAGINSQQEWNGQTWYMGGVTAWYPTDESVELGDQSERLAYILEGHEKTPNNNGSYYPDDEIPLEFKHLLAKVRVELKGERATAVNKVEVYSYTSCTHTEVPPTTHMAPYRKISTEGASQGWITMRKADYTDGNTYWEANLVPGAIENDYIRLNGTTVVPLSSLKELKAGNLHTVTVTVSAWPSGATQITSSDAISDNGNYYVTGNLTSAINITGGSPHIYLYNANVTNSTGSAISITGGATPTIHVVGAGNSVSSSNGAGIYVAQNSTVTITGSSRNDVLTARAGDDGAGIGGYGESSANYNPCGNITINNVTVYAYSAELLTSSPGIGSRESCGTITIDNATIYARGTASAMNGCPAIGSYASVPTITINGSDIYAYRGAYANGTSYADWIGRGGVALDYQGGAIQGDIRSTTVYKGKWTGSSEVSEGTVMYDASGVASEQSQ